MSIPVNVSNSRVHVDVKMNGQTGLVGETTKEVKERLAK